MTIFFLKNISLYFNPLWHRASSHHSHPRFHTRPKFIFFGLRLNFFWFGRHNKTQARNENIRCYMPDILRRGGNGLTNQQASKHLLAPWKILLLCPGWTCQDFFLTSSSRTCWRRHCHVGRRHSDVFGWTKSIPTLNSKYKTMIFFTYITYFWSFFIW